jgi:hypothetical protein
MHNIKMATLKRNAKKDRERQLKEFRDSQGVTMQESLDVQAATESARRSSVTEAAMRESAAVRRTTEGPTRGTTRRTTESPTRGY